MRLSRIAILGVGAIGSLLAELLVRGGAEDLLLVDGEDLEIGNLVRHRLRMDALGKKKASGLAEDLDLTSPHARVKAHDEPLPSDPEEARRLLEDYPIIIDCTGDDAVLQILSQAHWPLPKRFFSISVGYAAKRLYFFSAGGAQFPFDAFLTQVEPFLEGERRAMAGQSLPREGAGCWHPCWPARLDDVMLMAASASKLIENEVAAPSPPPSLLVFEKRAGVDGTFEGIRRVSTVPEQGGA
ncbi:MAG: ThiF family adenylyltransferase [Minicystis sp.]